MNRYFPRREESNHCQRISPDQSAVFCDHVIWTQNHWATIILPGLKCPTLNLASLFWPGQPHHLSNTWKLADGRTTGYNLTICSFAPLFLKKLDLFTKASTLNCLAFL